MNQGLSHKTSVKAPRKKTGPYIATVVMVFFLSLSAMNSIGFVPSYIDGVSPYAERAEELEREGTLTRGVSLSDLPELGPIQNEEPRVPGVNPERVIIRSIDVDFPVLNPTSRDVATLDAALMEGTVRYPDSAKLGERANMFIFGHTSRLPVVQNQNFRAFNRLPELEEGDTITVRGGGKDYLYRVTSVRLTDSSEAFIDLSSRGGTRLTLSTCTSFGDRANRWVVEAEFVGSFAS